MFRDMTGTPGRGARRGGEARGGRSQSCCATVPGTVVGLASVSATRLGPVSADAEREDPAKRTHCSPWGPSAARLSRRAGRWEAPNWGWERREDPLAILTSLFHSPLQSRLCVTNSQRGTGDANFISLDPSSLRLQQAGGRTQS